MNTFLFLQHLLFALLFVLRGLTGCLIHIYFLLLWLSVTLSISTPLPTTPFPTTPFPISPFPTTPSPPSTLTP